MSTQSKAKSIDLMDASSRTTDAGVDWMPALTWRSWTCVRWRWKPAGGSRRAGWTWCRTPPVWGGAVSLLVHVQWTMDIVHVQWCPFWTLYIQDNYLDRQATLELVLACTVKMLGSPVSTCNTHYRIFICAVLFSLLWNTEQDIKSCAELRDIYPLLRFYCRRYIGSLQSLCRRK